MFDPLMIAQRLPLWAGSFVAGFVLAMEGIAPYFFFIVVLTVVDIISAVALNIRLHKKYPNGKVSGKVESIKLAQSLWKLGYLFLFLLAGINIDVHLLGGDKMASSVVMWIYIFLTCWSVLENWSTASDKPFARLLQRILVDKTSRHLGVDLSELLDEDECEEKKHKKTK